MKLSAKEEVARNKFKKGIYPLLIELLNHDSLNSSEMCERVKHTTVVAELLKEVPKLAESQGISGSGKVDKRPKWYGVLRDDLGKDNPGYEFLIANGFEPVGDRKQRKWVKIRKDDNPGLDAFFAVKVEATERTVLTDCEKILYFSRELTKLAPNDKIFARGLEHAKSVYGE